MSNSIRSRIISEHLCTLATLLEAEAMRCKAYGAPNTRELSRQASEVRRMAEQLWDADVVVTAPGTMRRPVGRVGTPANRDTAGSLEAMGLAGHVAALAM